MMTINWSWDVFGAAKASHGDFLKDFSKGGMPCASWWMKQMCQKDNKKEVKKKIVKRKKNKGIKCSTYLGGY